jgi:hypothetical protein
VTDPDPSAAAPPKKPGLFRPAALWLLPLTVLVLLALVPLAVEPWLAGKVRSAVAMAGLELAPETQIAVSVFGGRITIDRLDLREVVDGQPRSLLKADRAELDADLLACLGGDVVLDTLVLEGASGDLRRRGDGTIPLATPPPEERGGTDWGKLDWWSYAKKAYEWQKGADAKAEQAESAPAEQKAPHKKPAHDWTGARAYEAAPGPRGPAMRVLIRDLRVSGRELLLPDDTPFAVTAFTAKGLNLGWGRRERGVDWGLDLQAQTRGAGGLDLGFGRGRVKTIAKQLPLAALAHPALAGEAIARHGASGTADLTLDAQWSQQLGGTIQATVSGLKLEPKDPTPRQSQIAQIVNRLGGKPLAWTMTLGGTPEQPEIADDGLEALAKGSLADAAKQAAIEEGTKRLEEQLQKSEKLQELQKNEDVKKATDKAKDLFKGLGK